MKQKGVVSKQRQLCDKVLTALEDAQLDLVRPYELLVSELNRQRRAKRELVNVSGNKESI